MSDHPITEATQIIATSISDGPRPTVKSFFDEATFTASHVIYDPVSREAAIIDSVMDYDPASGRTEEVSAQKIVDFIQAENLTVVWLLETHAHADHLSAAPWLQEKLGGKLAIGAQIIEVQRVFGKIFNAGTCFARDGSQFDHLFNDGDTFELGRFKAIALHVPGHTPADMAYIIGNVGFIGDTLFMPDFGTARADFPGGDARQLFQSIRRLLMLPRETQLYLCHDYKAAGRDAYCYVTTVGAERDNNIHVRDGVSEAEFVEMRQGRDATLAMPNLLMPSVQVNMRGGNLPEAEDDGTSYIKIPVNRL